MAAVEEEVEVEAEVEEVPPKDEGKAAAGDAPSNTSSGKHGAALARAEVLRVQGNDHLGKGNFADATKSYQDGLLAIVMVGGADAKRASETRVALHLNASLSELRRGNLGSVVDHASGALGMDPKNAKALYRRGLARARLSEHDGHESEATGALVDFEKAIELEPNNAEVLKQVKALREKMRSEKKDLNKSQKGQFKGMFSKGKALYEDTASVEEDKPVIRGDGSDGYSLAMSVEHVEFYYDKNETVLKDLSMELREGHCLGMCGNNATGKTTLARLMTDKLRPRKGEITHHSDDDGGQDDGEVPAGKGGSSRAVSAVGAVVVAATVTAINMIEEDADATKHWLFRLQWWHWLLLVASFGVWLVVAVRRFCPRMTCCPRRLGGARASTPGHRRRTVLHVSSESSDKEEIGKKMTVEDTISEKMPKRLSKEEKRVWVVAMLKAGGFQMYNQETGEPVGSPEEYCRDKLLFNQLSGGQKHLIYVLRCFAGRPEVLLCDELLGGLDSVRQPRVLRMLNLLKTEANTAVLYIGTELHQIRMVADTFAYLSGGRIVEQGPTLDVFDDPKHPATKDYVGTYKSLPGCSRIGGKLAEAYVALDGDAYLAAPWIPPRS